MKKFLVSLNIAIAALISMQATVAHAEAETKKACVKDAKTGKETCKVIKTHKKLEGTQVPEKKK